MTNEPEPSPRSRRAALRVPPFYPVPLRRTRGGWTIDRQAHFIGWLAETGSVTAACERVGLSRNSAYKLRRKPRSESFAAAWDAALGHPVRKVTIDDLPFLAYQGLIRPRFRGGRYIGSRQIPDSSALIRLVGRMERASGAEAYRG